MILPRRLAAFAVRIACLILAVALIGSCGATPRRTAIDVTQPPRAVNFVIVLADDLGYGDLGCYGHPVIKTPNLDRLAREGMRLTNCYSAAPNCSPARAGLLTGRIPSRVGIYNWIAEGSPVHLRDSEITFAELLKHKGYATAVVGKWHLNGGLEMPQPQPRHQGFDFAFVTQNNAEPSHHNPENFYRNSAPMGRIDGYSSTIIADRAIQWLSERPKDRPFVLFVSLHAPHEPIATAPQFMDLYDMSDPKRARYYGNVSQLDHEVGRIVDAIDEMRLRSTTFVMFTSDNGPAFRTEHPYGSAGPLREKKGSVYEGGVRVPGIIRFPGRFRPGMVSDEPVSAVDVLPTMAEIAGVPLPVDRRIDGTSFKPIFRSLPIQRRTPLFWHHSYSYAKPKVAMRIGDWKLLATVTGPEMGPSASIGPGDMAAIKSAELHSFELYNLRQDPGETIDLAHRDPHRLAVMSQQMKKLYDEVLTEGPVWPTWQRARARDLKQDTAR